jgi:hypothetical protein
MPEPGAPIPTEESLTLRDLDRSHPFERPKAYRVSGDTICDTLCLLALLEAGNRQLKMEALSSRERIAALEKEVEELTDELGSAVANAEEDEGYAIMRHGRGE